MIHGRVVNTRLFARPITYRKIQDGVMDTV